MKRIAVSFLMIGCASSTPDAEPEPLAAEVREGKWTIRDTKLFVRDMGPKEGPVLVVVHGGPGGNHRSMLPLDILASRYRLVFYDQRGTGESDRLGGSAALEKMTVAESVEDLEAMRQQLGRERISILGHSFGGALAIFYAAKYPQHIDRLIVYSGGPENNVLAEEKRTAHMAKMTDPEKEELAKRIQDLQAAAEKNEGEKKLDELFLKVAEVMFPSLYCKRPEKKSSDPGRAGFWASQAAGAYIEKFQRAQFADELKKIDRPVLLSWGRCEPSPKDRLLYLLDHLPNSQLVIFEESGHNALEEEPDLFIATIAAFLSGGQLPQRSYHDRQEVP
jgi:proline iminopeptidase